MKLTKREKKKKKKLLERVSHERVEYSEYK